MRDRLPRTGWISDAAAAGAAVTAPPTVPGELEAGAEPLPMAPPGDGDGFDESVEEAVAAFALGGELVKKKDLDGAELAYRRADELGHPRAPSELGALLEQRGEAAAALAAYRRADERQDAVGPFNLDAQC